MRAHIIVLLLLTLVAAQSSAGYIPPTPASLTNSTGEYWVNHTWAPGSSGDGTPYLISGALDGLEYGYNWTGSTWQADAAIKSGIPDVGINSAPEAFQIGDTWYMLVGESDGSFNGYDWTGSTWQVNAGIKSGIANVGTDSVPEAFQMGTTWYLITGTNVGTFHGYNWTGSTWQADSTIAAGLVDVGARSAPTVFQMDSTWYLISGELYGAFVGYNWTGSTWQADAAIKSGLIDVGILSSPEAFQMDSTWYLLAGEDDGVFNGYNWTGSTWQADAAIKSGLIDVGQRSAPTVFFMSPPANVTDSYNISVNDVWHNTTTNTYYKGTYDPKEWQNVTVWAYNTSGTGTLSDGSTSQNTRAPAAPPELQPNTYIRLDPHPDHIAFYVNSTYITCNFTTRESANVSIIFEKYNTTDNSSDTITDFGEFIPDQTAEFSVTVANFATVGWYRAAMYDIDGDILCYYEVAVRDNTSTNYEALHGSMRFNDADGVPSVSFVENIAGRAQTWTTNSISETHSIVLWEYDSAWTMAAGGDYTYIDHANTSANLTNWVLSQTYDVNRYYRMILYSHDDEVLDTHCVRAVIPTANIVEVRVEDSQKSIPIPVFTVTMNGQTQNITDGVAYFTNVTNGAHIITVTAENYLDAQKTIYMANSYVNTTVYMLAYYPFAPAHKDVEFIVTSIFNKRYADVAVTANYLTPNGDATSMSGTTDSTGSITFSMVATTSYTISFINDTQGVNKTITIRPKDSRYIITVGIGGKWTEYEDRPMDSIHITVKKSVINDTHAYINVTYRDDTNGTQQLMAWINQTNPHDPRNATGIASYTFSGNLNDTNHSFIVSPYTGQSYQVRIWHEHDQFGTFYDRSIRFAGMLIDLGLPSAFYFWFAIGTLFFVAAFFGATTTSVGSIIVCALGWVFLAIGWLAALGIFGPISLTLASVYAVANNLITRHHRGGFA